MQVTKSASIAIICLTTIFSPKVRLVHNEVPIRTLHGIGSACIIEDDYEEKRFAASITAELTQVIGDDIELLLSEDAQPDIEIEVRYNSIGISGKHEGKRIFAPYAIMPTPPDEVIELRDAVYDAYRNGTESSNEEIIHRFIGQYYANLHCELGIAGAEVQSMCSRTIEAMLSGDPPHALLKQMIYEFTLDTITWAVVILRDPFRRIVAEDKNFLIHTLLSSMTGHNVLLKDVFAMLSELIQDTNTIPELSEITSSIFNAVPVTNPNAKAAFEALQKAIRDNQSIAHSAKRLSEELCDESCDRYIMHWSLRSFLDRGFISLTLHNHGNGLPLTPILLP